MKTAAAMKPAAERRISNEVISAALQDLLHKDGDYLVACISSKKFFPADLLQKAGMDRRRGVVNCRDQVRHPLGACQCGHFGSGSDGR